MKTIKLLAIIGVLFLTSFGNEVKAQKKDGWYYYCYARSWSNYNHSRIYITPVMHAPCNGPWGSSLPYEARLEFVEYMRAEYRNTDEYDIGCDGAIIEGSILDGEEYNKLKVSQAKREAVSDRRKIMARYDEVVKITDFEYECD